MFPLPGTVDVLAVIPVLVGPMQVLIPILWGVLAAVLASLLALLKPRSLLLVLRLCWRQKLAVLILAGLGWGAVEGIGWLKVRLGSQTVARIDGSWPMARGGLDRRGADVDARMPLSGGIHWTWKDGEAGLLSSPAVVGDHIFISTARLGAFGGEGRILCLNAASGAVVWDAAPKGYRPTFSSPVVVGDALVCGEGVHTTRDARVICLDARSGAVRWTQATSSHVECTPVVWQGKVYVGAGDDGYYCLDLSGDGRGGAKVLWHLPGDRYLDAETSLAVADGRVYAGLGIGGKALCVLDALTGAELAREAMPYPVFSPPALDAERIYLGMGEGDYIKAGRGGELRCLDRQSLKTLWKAPLEATVLGAVVLSGEEVIAVSRDGRISVFDRDGHRVSTGELRSPVIASPVVTDNHLGVLGSDGLFTVFDRRSLTARWRLQAGTSGLFVGSPVLWRDRVIIPSQEHGLIAAGTASGGTRALLWAGPMGGTGCGGNPERLPLPAVGTLSWNHLPDADADQTQALQVAPAAVGNDLLFVPLARGAQAGLLALPPTGGQNAPAPRWLAPVAAGVHRSPVLTNDTVLALTGEPPVGLLALASVDGARRWQRTFGQADFLTVSKELVLVADLSAGVLLGLDPAQGQECWRHRATLSADPAISGALLIVATDQPPGLTALDLPTGRPLWTVEVPTAIRHLAVQGPCLFVNDGGPVRRLSLMDGQTLTDSKLPAVSSPFTLSGDGVYAITTEGELVRLDTPIVERRKLEAFPHLPALPLRQGLLVFTRNGPSLVTDGGVTLWCDLRAFNQGLPSAPAVVAGSALFTSFPGSGLLRLGAP